MTTDTDPPPDDDAPPEPDAGGDEITAEDALAEDRNQREWVRTITSFLDRTIFRDGTFHEPGGTAEVPTISRIRGPLREATVAALARLTRIFESDLPLEDQEVSDGRA